MKTIQDFDYFDRKDEQNCCWNGNHHHAQSLFHGPRKFSTNWPRWNGNDGISDMDEIEWAKGEINQNQDLQNCSCWRRPLLDCAVYTENKPYSKCARKERVDIFTKEIGWTPPVLETNPKKICNKKFNFPNQNDECIKALFNPLYIHNWEFGRKQSCTKNMYTSRFLHTSPSPGPSKMVLSWFLTRDWK